MKTKHLTIIAILAAALASALASCSKDDEPGRTVPADACYDFVTLASKGPAQSLFSLQMDGDSPVIQYTSPYVFNGKNDAKLADGQRIIILYRRIAGEPYTSGPIDLYGYRVLDNSPQKVDPSAAAKSDPVKMTSITRTGQYLNMQLQISCQQALKPKALKLCCDGLQAEWPELTLVYESAMPGENYANAYASFDISLAWDCPETKGVAVRYLTPDGWQSKTFSKQTENTDN